MSSLTELVLQVELDNKKYMHIIYASFGKVGNKPFYERRREGNMKLTLAFVLRVSVSNHYVNRCGQ